MIYTASNDYDDLFETGRAQENESGSDLHCEAVAKSKYDDLLEKREFIKQLRKDDGNI